MQGLPLFPPQASSIAGEVDALYFFLTAVAAFFSLLIGATIIFFAIRYRRRSNAERPPEIEGSLALELAWTIVPLILVTVMFVWGAQVFFHMNRPPDDAMERSGGGKRWVLKLQHPTGPGRNNGPDGPVGRPVELTIT